MNEIDFRNLRYYRPADVPDYGKLKQELIRRLDDLVGLLGLKGPISIISGWRSPEHNAAIGGAEKSRHLTGEAVDVPIPIPNLASIRGIEQFFKLAATAGFNGLGVYYDPNATPHFTAHLDIRPIRGTWGRIGGRSEPYIGFDQALSRIAAILGHKPVAVTGRNAVLLMIGIIVLTFILIHVFSK